MGYRPDDFEFQCSVYDLYNPREHDIKHIDINNDGTYDEYLPRPNDNLYFYDPLYHHRCIVDYDNPDELVIHHDHRRADNLTRRPDDECPVLLDPRDLDL